MRKKWDGKMNGMDGWMDGWTEEKDRIEGRDGWAGVMIRMDGCTEGTHGMDQRDRQDG